MGRLIVDDELLWTATEYSKLEQEIESLRMKLELTSASQMRAIGEKDEWKRRAVMMWEFIGGEYFYVPSVPAGVLDIRKTFLKTYPEAAIWFEEE